jgi:2-oxoglutarate dehydrogenase E1 component
MGEGKLPIDWGMGENLAYASLVASGYGVRLSGEDVGRSTFFHRHAVLHDQNREKWDDRHLLPAGHVAGEPGAVSSASTPCCRKKRCSPSSTAMPADPNTLVIWEAQFGDFANGAQVVIDQFIASGEAKWGRATA